MAVRAEEIATVSTESGIVSGGCFFLLCGSSLYRLTPSALSPFQSFAFPISSAVFTPRGSLVLSSPGQLSLLNVSNSHCHDPSHDRGKVLFKGTDLSPPTILAVDGTEQVPHNQVAAQIAREVVLFHSDGTLKRRVEAEQTFVRGCMGDDESVVLAEADGSVWLWEERGLREVAVGHRASCVLWGNELLCGTEAGVVVGVNTREGDAQVRFDVNSTLPPDSQTAVHSLCALESERLLVGCPQHFLVLSDWTVIFAFDIAACSEIVMVSPSAFACVFTYSSSVSVYSLIDSEEEYADDFEEETEEAPLQVPRTEETTVVMKFEPTLGGLLSLAAPTQTAKRPQSKGKKQLQNKPVTFHKKVKSSGYCTNPKPKSRPIVPKPAPTVSRELPINPDPANQWTGEKLYNAAVFQVEYSPDGGRLGACGSDATGFVVKLPVGKWRGERTPLIGHVQSVVSFAWSATGSMILTSSLDRTTKLWASSGANPGQCLLTLPYFSPSSLFYYKDRFLTVCDIEKVRFFTYKLTDPTEKDDVKRLQARCKYKERSKIVHPSAQAVTRIAAHNQFLSHVVVLAGSNKVVSVWDLDRGAEIRSFEDPHRKSIHCLRFFKPNGDSPNYEDGNLLLTAAADNELHLFDLRMQGIVAMFTGHQNTSQELTGDISPNGLLLAYGSEDRAVYLWDLRSTRLLEKVRGFRDIVSTVSFSPSGTLCAGGYDGALSFFSG